MHIKKIISVFNDHQTKHEILLNYVTEDFNNIINYGEQSAEHNNRLIEALQGSTGKQRRGILAEALHNFSVSGQISLADVEYVGRLIEILNYDVIQVYDETLSPKDKSCRTIWNAMENFGKKPFLCLKMMTEEIQKFVGPSVNHFGGQSVISGQWRREMIGWAETDFPAPEKKLWAGLISSASDRNLIYIVEKLILSEIKDKGVNDRLQKMLVEMMDSANPSVAGEAMVIATELWTKGQLRGSSGNKLREKTASEVNNRDSKIRKSVLKALFVLSLNEKDEPLAETMAKKIIEARAEGKISDDWMIFVYAQQLIKQLAAADDISQQIELMMKELKSKNSLKVMGVIDALGPYRKQWSGWKKDLTARIFLPFLDMDVKPGILVGVAKLFIEMEKEDLIDLSPTISKKIKFYVRNWLADVVAEPGIIAYKALSVLADMFMFTDSDTVRKMKAAYDKAVEKYEEKSEDRWQKRLLVRGEWFWNNEKELKAQLTEMDVEGGTDDKAAVIILMGLLCGAGHINYEPAFIKDLLLRKMKENNSKIREAALLAIINLRNERKIDLLDAEMSDLMRSSMANGWYKGIYFYIDKVFGVPLYTEKCFAGIMISLLREPGNRS